MFADPRNPLFGSLGNILGQHSTSSDSLKFRYIILKHDKNKLQMFP